MTSSVEKTEIMSREDLVYESLCKLKEYKKSEPIRIYLQTGEEKVKRIVLGILGSGGSKRAYELEGGTALLMSCGRSLSSTASSRKWSEMVDEEIIGTRRVKELGLLSCNLTKTTVFMTHDSMVGVPAYTTKTFQQLSSEGMWIIDLKNPKSTNWDRSLFHETTDSFDEKNWEKVLNPFLNDVAILLANNFWLYVDNVSIAVLERSDQSDGVMYEVRYFGFDFSSKYGQLSFKKLSFEEISSLVPFIVGDVLSCVMDCELKLWNERRQALRQYLKEKCIKQILSEVTLQTSHRTGDDQTH